METVFLSLSLLQILMMEDRGRRIRLKGSIFPPTFWFVDNLHKLLTISENLKGSYFYIHSEIKSYLKISFTYFYEIC